jgi:hypothetical protein
MFAARTWRTAPTSPPEIARVVHRQQKRDGEQPRVARHGSSPLAISSADADAPTVIESFADGFDHGPGYFCQPAVTLTKLGRLIAL